MADEILSRLRMAGAGLILVGVLFQGTRILAIGRTGPEPGSVPGTLSPALGRLWKEMPAAPPAAKNLSATAVSGSVPGDLAGLLSVNQAGLVGVRIWTETNPTNVLPALAEAGFELFEASPSHRLLEGRLPARALVTVATLPGVRSVLPLYRPLQCAGSATTQGDAVHLADAVRSRFGFDGAGIKVGVLSDSANRLGGGLCDSVRSGDLPGTVTSNGCLPAVEVLRDYIDWPYETDEGRALLEIVHDLAPGAQLAFHTAMYGALSFASGIRALANHGCRVLVDDMIYLDEPWFQDGIVAQAVEEVAQYNGVCYFSAAGNLNGKMYSGTFQDTDGWHNFDTAGGVDLDLRVTVPPGTPGVVASYAYVFLQWNEPWWTSNGVKNELDPVIYDETGTNLLNLDPATDNLATQQAFELASWKNTGPTPKACRIRIHRRAGTGPLELKLLVRGATLDERAGGGSIVAQAASASALCVGAVPWYRPDTIEPSSSHGPVTIYSDKTGQPLATPQTRAKPDLAATDNVNTSFFGSDIPEDTDTLPNFAGTSAAVAHAAGVAALVWSANPGLSPGQLGQLLRNSAVDLGDPGWDPLFGYGRVNALAALTNALLATDTIGPVVRMISPPATTPRHVTFVQLGFNEALNASDATNPALYELRGAGADGTFGTADDPLCTVSAVYDAVYGQVRLDLLTPTNGLSSGAWRLLVRAGVRDLAGNSLAGGPQTLGFSIGPWDGLVPLATTGTGMRVAVNGAGRAAVVWGQYSQFADHFLLSMYDENGACVADRITVADVGESEGEPWVSINDEGLVAVAYNERWAQFDCAIHVARFAPDGSALPELSPIDGGFNTMQKAVVLPNGEVAVVWVGGENSGPVWLSLFDRAGSVRISKFQLHPNGAHPTIACDREGNLMAAWVQGTSGALVYTNLWAQRFDAQGNPRGDMFRVHTNTDPCQREPDIAFWPDGSHIIVWNSEPSHYFSQKIRGRCFQADGTALDNDFEIASLQYCDVNQPAVAALPGGQFIVTYVKSTDLSRTYLSWARRYLACGVPLGDPIVLDTQGASASVGADEAGAFLIATAGPKLRWQIPPLPELADLQPTQLTAPETAAIGSPLQISATVGNHSLVTAAASEARFYLSPDPEITGAGNDRLLGVAELGAMWGGATAGLSPVFTVEWPGELLLPGAYWLGVVVDATNSVAEISEQNNILTTPIRILNPMPARAELTANVTTSASRQWPGVVAAPDNSFVIGWSGTGTGDTNGVFVRRFDPYLGPLSEELRVNQTTNGTQQMMSGGRGMSADTNGNLWVAWGNGDGTIYARRFASTLAPLSDEFLVKSSPGFPNSTPTVAVSPDGTLAVVAWIACASSSGSNPNYFFIRAQCYDTNGNKVGSEFQPSQRVGYYAGMPHVVFLSNDRFLLAWSYGQYINGDYYILCREYTAAGVPVSDEMFLAGAHYQAHTNPSLAPGRNGRLLVVWDYRPTPDNGSGEILGAWLVPGSQHLEPQGGTFVVNSLTQNKQQQSQAAALSNGRFLACWVRPDPITLCTDIQGQLFSADGARLGPEWRLNSVAAGSQVSPAAASLAGDAFVAAWGANPDPGACFGTPKKIGAQVFGFPADPLLTVPASLTVNELDPLTFTNSATHADRPANTLTFALLSAPAGLSLDAHSGVLTWTPSEAQGPSTNLVTLRVFDDGSPVLSATNSFTITVKEVNAAPVLVLPPDQFADEMTPITVTLAATDVDVPTNTIRFGLVSAPAGLTLNTNTGEINWTPTETQGPNTNLIVVRAVDNGVPPLALTNSFTVVVNEANTPPVLIVPTNRVIKELATLTVTNSATDADRPANVLRFELVTAPAGLILNPTNGVLTWTPTETQGPSTNLITLRVFDDGSPPRSATNSFTITVNEVNSAPTLVVPSDLVVDELVPMAVTLTATDPDAPPNLIRFGLVSAPAGLTLNTNTGEIAWTPSETQGPSTNTITVRAVDDGTPALARTNSFKVIVKEVNTPPLLTVPADRAINELATLTVTNTATDADRPANTLVFALATAPSGMAINANTGVITWTPNEVQGPSTNLVTVVVTDNGQPALGATNSFTIVVNEVNTAPILTVPAKQAIAELATLTVTNSATDADRPANAPTFELVAAPAGVAIDATAGILTWTPTEAQGPSTNLITVRVYDNGSPPLSATNSFTITVNEVNSAPTLVVPSDLVVDELVPMAVTLTATDPDAPPNLIRFGLVSAPAGLTLNTNTGEIAWTPSEAQGPSTNTIVVRAVDNGTPSLATTNSFKVTVNEVNSAPAVRIMNPTNDTVVIVPDLLLQAEVTEPDRTAARVVFTATGLGGFTNRSLGTVSNAPFEFTWTNAAAGEYNLTAQAYSASGDSCTSAPVRVLIRPAAPVVTTQPVSQTVWAGRNATLSAAVSGVPAPKYQWRFLDVPIPGATSNSLSLLEAQTIQSGPYTLTASNAFGVATSAVALVVVNPVLPLPPTLDASNLEWTSSGQVPWFGQTNAAHDGRSAAQSGWINHSQKSTLQTTIVGPGTLTFWWKVSSEACCDKLTFLTNSIAAAVIAGTADWQYRALFLPPGTNLLQWTYSKDSSSSIGLDAGWVDQVEFAPLAVAPGGFSNRVFRIPAMTVGGRSYGLEYKDSLTDTNWTALPLVSGNNAMQHLLDTNTPSARRFYRLRVQ